MEVIIENAQLSDVDELAKLFDKYRIFYDQTSDITLAIDFLTDRLRNAESVIFKAQDTSGRYVGFTQLYPSFSSIAARPTWVLNDLYVLEDARGYGIGRRLLSSARDYAIATKAKGLTLAAAKDNYRAQRLYESFGFNKSSLFNHYYLDLDSE